MGAGIEKGTVWPTVLDSDFASRRGVALRQGRARTRDLSRTRASATCVMRT